MVLGASLPTQRLLLQRLYSNSSNIVNQILSRSARRPLVLEMGFSWLGEMELLSGRQLTG